MTEDLVIGRFLALRDAGLPMTIHGDGRQTRDYTFTDDVVRAALLAGERDLPAGVNTILNVGAGVETSLLELARMLGGEFQLVPNPRGGMDEERKIADLSRIGKILGWRPETGLKDGLEICAAAAAARPDAHRQ